MLVIIRGPLSQERRLVTAKTSGQAIELSHYYSIEQSIHSTEGSYEFRY